MHHLSLAPATLDAPVAAPAEDTYDEREYADLCDTIQATYLGGELLPAVQAAVTNAYLTRRERWVKEAQTYLRRFGICFDCSPAPMAVVR